jgi:tetratricopeptide (TPR) repeat protein
MRTRQAESIAVKRMTSGSLAVILAFGVSLAQGVDPDAVKRRALALAEAGDYVQARADLERLVSEWPDDRLARKPLARVLIAAGATSDAATHLERLVRTDGTDAEAWSLLGRLHQDAQRFGEAARALDRAVRLDASDVAALTALANAYVGLGRIETADCDVRARDPDERPAFAARRRTARVLRRVPPSRQSPRRGGNAGATRRGDRSGASSRQGRAAGARAASGRHHATFSTGAD